MRVRVLSLVSPVAMHGCTVVLLPCCFPIFYCSTTSQQLSTCMHFYLCSTTFQQLSTYMHYNLSICCDACVTGVLFYLKNTYNPHPPRASPTLPSPAFPPARPAVGFAVGASSPLLLAPPWQQRALRRRQSSSRERDRLRRSCPRARRAMRALRSSELGAPSPLLFSPLVAASGPAAVSESSPVHHSSHSSRCGVGPGVSFPIIWSSIGGDGGRRGG